MLWGINMFCANCGAALSSVPLAEVAYAKKVGKTCCSEKCAGVLNSSKVCSIDYVVEPQQNEIPILMVRF